MRTRTLAGSSVGRASSASTTSSSTSGASARSLATVAPSVGSSSSTRCVTKTSLTLELPQVRRARGRGCAYSSGVQSQRSTDGLRRRRETCQRASSPRSATIAAAIPSWSSGSNSSPFTPSRTRSGMPPCARSDDRASARERFDARPGRGPHEREGRNEEAAHRRARPRRRPSRATRDHSTLAGCSRMQRFDDARACGPSPITCRTASGTASTTRARRRRARRRSCTAAAPRRTPREARAGSGVGRRLDEDVQVGPRGEHGVWLTADLADQRAREARQRPGRVGTSNRPPSPIASASGARKATRARSVQPVRVRQSPCTSATIAVFDRASFLAASAAAVSYPLWQMTTSGRESAQCAREAQRERAVEEWRVDEVRPEGRQQVEARRRSTGLTRVRASRAPRRGRPTCAAVRRRAGTRTASGRRRDARLLLHAAASIRIRSSSP